MKMVFSGKALSVTQPSAAAIAYAGKDIENRSWFTHYRGPLAIHASGKVYKEYLDEPQRQVRGGRRRPLIDWIKKGARRHGIDVEAVLAPSQIVAIAMLVDCVEGSSSPWYYPGNWAWVMEGVVPIQPVPKVGGLSPWDCRFEYRPQIAR